MSKTNELARVTRTLNNLWHSCQKANEVHFDEIEVKNHWESVIHEGLTMKNLAKQEIVIRLTLFGAKDERP